VTVPATFWNSPRTFVIIMCRTVKDAVVWLGSIFHVDVVALVLGGLAVIGRAPRSFASLDANMRPPVALS
jgi:hypothetical protein